MLTTSIKLVSGRTTQQCLDAEANRAAVTRRTGGLNAGLRAKREKEDYRRAEPVDPTDTDRMVSASLRVSLESCRFHPPEMKRTNSYVTLAMNLSPSLNPGPTYSYIQQSVISVSSKILVLNTFMAHHSFTPQIFTEEVHAR